MKKTGIVPFLLTSTFVLSTAGAVENPSMRPGAAGHGLAGQNLSSASGGHPEIAHRAPDSRNATASSVGPLASPSRSPSPSPSPLPSTASSPSSLSGSASTPAKTSVRDPILMRARDATLSRAQAVAAARANRESLGRAQAVVDGRAQQVARTASELRDATGAQTRLAARIAEAQKDLVRARLASTKADALLAKANAERRKSLTKKSADAAREISDAQAALIRLQSSLVSAQAAGQTASERLARTQQDLAVARNEASIVKATWAKSETAAEEARKAERLAHAPIDQANRERARHMADAIARAAYDIDSSTQGKNHALAAVANAYENKSAADRAVINARKRLDDARALVQRRQAAFDTANQLKLNQPRVPTPAAAAPASSVPQPKNAPKKTPKAEAGTTKSDEKSAARLIAAAHASLDEATNGLKAAEIALQKAEKSAADAAVMKIKSEVEARRASEANSRANAEREENMRSAGNYHVTVPVTEKNTPDMESFYRAAVWGADPQHRVWTDIALATIRANIDRLEMARDKEDFCPGYSDASEHEHEVCWLRIVGSVSKFESSFNMNDGFQEPSGQMSVGLLALSPKECKEYQTEHLLKIGVLNLACGVSIMARLTESHGFLDGPESSRGAAAYWSVLREPYSYGEYNLGKKYAIIKITRHYREF